MVNSFRKRVKVMQVPGEGKMNDKNNISPSGDLLSVLLENLQTAVFVVNKNNSIHKANKSFLSLFHDGANDIPGPACDGTEGCNKCKLRDSLIEPLTHKVPVKRMRLTRRFFINGMELVKYFVYSTNSVNIDGQEMTLVTLDDISDAMEAHLKLKRVSITDGLTQLYNHRHIYQKLEEELIRARRYGNKLSIIMLDIDNFKSINDTYGHLVGDNTLVTISQIILNSLRDIDAAGRYESVEFLIILPQTILENAYLTAERIRRAVASHRFEEEELKMTLSGGVAELQPGNGNPLHLIDHAENLLYKAKQEGRNLIKK
jgi:diguanylate cyclase (GGDEF)-like protein